MLKMSSGSVISAVLWIDCWDCGVGDTFGEVLRVAPDDPADTRVDQAVLVAGNVDRDDLSVCQ